MATCASKMFPVDVQYLQIESEFAFGDVRFVPLDDHFFERMTGIGANFPPDKAANFLLLVNNMKERMLGLAAVRLKVFSLSRRTQKRQP